jgi:hypothetical protein
MNSQIEIICFLGSGMTLFSGGRAIHHYSVYTGFRIDSNILPAVHAPGEGRRLGEARTLGSQQKEFD